MASRRTKTIATTEKVNATHLDPLVEEVSDHERSAVVAEVGLQGVGLAHATLSTRPPHRDRVLHGQPAGQAEHRRHQAEQRGHHQHPAEGQVHR